MDRPIRIVPPADMPVSLDEAKAAVRVDGDVENAFLEHLIASAVDHLDGRAGLLGRCMVTQTWRYRTNRLSRETLLDMPDGVGAVIRYRTTGGGEETVPDDHLHLVEGVKGVIVFYTGPGFVTAGAIDAISLDVTFGWEPAQVPVSLKRAILMLVAHWFTNREAIGDGRLARIPYGVDDLIASYRWLRI